MAAPCLTLNFSSALLSTPKIVRYIVRPTSSGRLAFLHARRWKSLVGFPCNLFYMSIPLIFPSSFNLMTRLICSLPIVRLSGGSTSLKLIHMSLVFLEISTILFSSDQAGMWSKAVWMLLEHAGETASYIVQSLAYLHNSMRSVMLHGIAAWNWIDFLAFNPLTLLRL